MRTWASWTAKTALLAAGFAAAGGGLSGVALAGSGGGAAILPAARAPQTPASDPGSGNVAGSGNVSAGRGNTVSLPVSLPVDICGNAAAVLGDSTAGCAGGALAGLAIHQAAGNSADAITGSVIQSAVAPLSSLAPLSTVTASSAATPGIHGASGPAAPTPGSGRTHDSKPGAAASADDTNVPAASQLAGLGPCRVSRTCRRWLV